MKKRILVAAPDFPYPPNHGGRVDIWKRLKNLKDLGYVVDLVATVKSFPPQEDLDYVKNVLDDVFIVHRGGGIMGLFGLRPHQVLNRKELTKVAFKGEYEHLIIEGSTCEMVLENTSLEAKNVILRVHNNEALYFKKLSFSTKNIVKFLYFFLEFLKFSVSERKLYKKLNHFLFISKDEQKVFLSQQRNTAKNSLFLPPSISPVKREKVLLDNNRRVLFVGSLFMPNNKDGLKWYIKEVHPKIRHIDGYKFVIAGNSRGISTDWITKGPYGTEIEFHDSPRDITALYESVSVFVNPMRFGAGMKIKTIEALCQKLPVVSTSTGIEGTGLDHGHHVYCSDNAASFAHYVEELLVDKERASRMIDSALSYVYKSYNSKEKLSLFLTKIEGTY